ncbi:MAG: glycosyltransferase family 2 protein [Lachnospiraceae bacterium]|nr:glycosyltransferase family 2 protein [Lachnospiraceae bacterium]
MKKVSVIIPVYNCENYIKRCLDSVIRQTYNNLEIIVIDDGSKDNSPEICDNYAKIDNRIKVIHKINGGLGAARNTGIENATGEYIAFVDGDDWIVDDMYEYLIHISEKYSAEICGADMIITSDENKKVKNKEVIEEIYEGDNKIREYLSIGMKQRNSQYSACNKIYKKALFESIKFPVNQLFEDVATNYRLIDKANKFVVSNKPVYFYYQKSVSITRKKCSEKDFDLLKVGKEIKELSKNRANEIVLCADEYNARTYFSLMVKIKLYGLDENFDNGKEYIKRLKLDLQANYGMLMSSKMPFNRKIILWLMLKHEKVLDLIIKVYKMKG